MTGSDEDLAGFLRSFGFKEDELFGIQDEINAFRSIPGTTIERYLSRIINTIDDDDRPAFLKGVMAGVAIKSAADALSEPDLTDDEIRIDEEIERLKSSK
ncbi:Uncharacterised protein [uncultured archaeon]|nr:Uncharacterised protein [uncultured archaeon]